MNGQSVFFNPFTVSFDLYYMPPFKDFICRPVDRILRFSSIANGFWKAIYASMNALK